MEHTPDTGRSGESGSMAAPNNNRRHSRVAVSDTAPGIKVYVQTATGGTDARTVRAHDLSSMGLSFHSPTPIAPNTRCTTVINHNGRPIRVIARVANCRADGDKGHMIGLRFTSLTPMATDEATPSLVREGQIDRILVDP